MGERTIEPLEWEADLKAEGMDLEEVAYRRFREELLLDRAGHLQNAVENLAASVAVGLEGGTAAKTQEVLKAQREKYPDEGLEKELADFREEVRLSLRFLAGHGFDRLRMEEVA